MADGTRLERELRGSRDDAAVEPPEDPALRLVLVDDHQLLHLQSTACKLLVIVSKCTGELFLQLIGVSTRIIQN